jgi:hypothetical protein
MIMGAATALVLDARDRRIKTADEARELLSEFPILGVIPGFEQKDLIVTTQLGFISRFTKMLAVISKKKHFVLSKPICVFSMPIIR